MAPPEHLPGVVGHTAAQARLCRAMARGKLHHGMILVGPRGVGKAALARGLGCALHCEQAPGRGCGRCNGCRRVVAGTHVGVEWIRPEPPGTAIKVTAARELATRLELAPFEGAAHLVVFDPADALNEHAYNALLKAIEEPRPGVHFVMIAVSLAAVLPTILSRCAVVRLGRLQDDEVATIVHQRLREAPEDATPPPPERIDLAVRLAEGSAGVATELAFDDTLAPALALLQRMIEAATAGPGAVFGGDKSPLWSAWAEAVGPAKTGRPARERALAARTGELWLLHLRECMRGRSGLPGVEPEDVSDPPRVLRRLDRIQAWLEGLDRNPNVRLQLEQTLLQVIG